MEGTIRVGQAISTSGEGERSPRREKSSKSQCLRAVGALVKLLLSPSLSKETNFVAVELDSYEEGEGFVINYLSFNIFPS